LWPASIAPGFSGNALLFCILCNIGSRPVICIPHCAWVWPFYY
jgi:hypothetical protein